jgi:hypothetical protein
MFKLNPITGRLDLCSDIVEDTTPQLGGNLDCNEHTITNLENDAWVSGSNFANSAEVNIVKVNADDEIDVGGTLKTGVIEIIEDSGAVTLVDFPVSATPTEYP